mmetsp:Transcript_38805/g.39496  ORF Transcript_38805/g.39496 Transcript_38805/m.39496 type:complete len:268 (+) Transcript_38805:355-1158(+)|eukprot:CAMPEP_0182417296 /NCGR_PEP_ID=MMETSP1167-20130531/1725_1 /TAXON_ID=2988 /ORGANISM="Mallomonas Sp, Strain CCMP3275" /LENGTH=267 /DNA_ID=CAMNT_0024590729 /DNA_START=333 /DNA_END=1139 /DNA_ORIENTATION=+
MVGTRSSNKEKIGVHKAQAINASIGAKTTHIYRSRKALIPIANLYNDRTDSFDLQKELKRYYVLHRKKTGSVRKMFKVIQSKIWIDNCGLAVTGELGICKKDTVIPIDCRGFTKEEAQRYEEANGGRLKRNEHWLIGGDEHLLCSTNSMNEVNLGGWINCSLSLTEQDRLQGWSYEKMLRLPITDKDLDFYTHPNCSLHVGPEEHCYARVFRDLYPGEELLLSCGSSHRTNLGDYQTFLDKRAEQLHDSRRRRPRRPRNFSDSDDIR